MSDQYPVNPRQDEIDLGQVFSLISKGFNNLFKIFLRLFVYVRSNILILGILAIIGLVIGYGLNTIISERLKIEVIVSPNLESKNYLYTGVEELNGKIKAKDSAFFALLDIEIGQVEKFEIAVEDLLSISDKEREAQMKYLEVLKDIEGSTVVRDLIQELLLDQNSLDQRITFYYKDAVSGPEAAGKLLNYLNNNSYYRELLNVHNGNATRRISQNTAILEQMDAIIEKFTEGLNTSQTPGTLVLAEEDDLNVADLFALKNSLITQTELKRIELQERQSPFSIINFGGPQPVKKPLFGKSLFLVPFVLIALFVFKDVIGYLNRKSNEMLS